MHGAIEIQRAILMQGRSAMTKTDFIRSTGKFRLERRATMKPLVCACLAQEPDKFLIVGVCGKPRLGAIQGNSFGFAFRTVAEELGAGFSHELFESSWIIVDTVVVRSFMLRLTQKL
ncbi:hypothetical protein Cni_G24950 [Canna indica]|uniref:Uncharacterized protein n=1 Tax=Canna indica TaxID=4628 RepID=A0AAQ3QNR4_9LILI|nr:hypothetical protein Cni_G24950 [Canna indica]